MMDMADMTNSKQTSPTPILIVAGPSRTDALRLNGLSPLYVNPKLGWTYFGTYDAPEAYRFADVSYLTQYEANETWKHEAMRGVPLAQLDRLVRYCDEDELVAWLSAHPGIVRTGS